MPDIENKKTIAVLGGGPTSLIAVLEILRKAPLQNETKTPLQINWVAREPKEKLGQGELLGAAHTEVLFNTAVEDMSFSLDNLDEFADYLANNDIDEKSRNIITKSNTRQDLKAQFVPRHLLRSTPARLLVEIEALAKEKHVEINFIRGDVRSLRNENETPHSRSVISIDEINDKGRKTGSSYELAVDVSAIVFGSPKKELPNEKNLTDGNAFSRNPYHPRKNHALHPNADLTQLAPNHVFGIGGTKLSGVDVAVVLNERGYFEQPHRKVVFFSPSGDFPLPHEPKNSNADGSYKDNSLISDPDVPQYLRQPSSARELINSILLSVAYAAGVVYRNGQLHDDKSTISAKHLSRVASALEEAGDYVKTKFAAENRRAYGVQVPISVEYHPMMPGIWQNFSGKDKVDFTRDGQNVYDTYRHRVPLKVLEMLNERVANGQIIIEKSPITSLANEAGKIRVSGNDGKFVDVDSFAKATGWDRAKPIEVIPALESSHKNGVVESEKDSGLGVVVSDASKHNTLIVGQLNWVRYFEIQGLQRLLDDGRQSADVLLEMANKQSTSRFFKSGPGEPALER